MNIIETVRLTRRYRKTEAVHELNLAVPEGSVTALLGPNGAGKTTTLKLLMHQLEASSGSATVLGVDSRLLGERERAQIGYISENQQLPDWMSVGQFLDFCRPFYPTWDRALEAKLLAQFDLPPDRPLRQLSRGMRMKAALLSSLAYRPRLLVLDEPFSGLDPLVRDDVVRGLLEAAQLGEWSVLVSTHDIEEVERLSDRIALLESGRLQFAESTESLLNRFRSIELTLPSTQPLPTQAEAGWLDWRQEGELVRYVDPTFAGAGSEAAIAARHPYAAVRIRPLSLRDIFISMGRSRRNPRKGVQS